MVHIINQSTSHFKGKQTSSQQVICSGHYLGCQNDTDISYGKVLPNKIIARGFTLSPRASASKSPCTHSLKVNLMVIQVSRILLSSLLSLFEYNLGIHSNVSLPDVSHVWQFLWDALEISWPNSSPAPPLRVQGGKTAGKFFYSIFVKQ